MRRHLFAFIMLSMMLAVATQHAVAQKSPVVAWNKTSDAWAWMTAYSSGHIQSAWCVAPGKRSVDAFNFRITELRVEVTHKNCAHPVMLDKSIGPRKGTVQINGLIEGSKGRYTFRNF